MVVKYIDRAGYIAAAEVKKISKKKSAILNSYFLLIEINNETLSFEMPEEKIEACIEKIFASGCLDVSLFNRSNRHF